MRVVLDANVIIAAFAARGLCESIFEVCLSDHDLFVSNHLLGEIGEKLAGKLKLPRAAVVDAMRLLTEQATLTEPAFVPADACRDPDDAPVLGLAVAASASCLVTGDKDLLVLKQFRGIPICTPRHFADLIQGEADAHPVA